MKTTSYVEAVTMAVEDEMENVKYRENFEMGDSDCWRLDRWRSFMVTRPSLTNHREI